MIGRRAALIQFVRMDLPLQEILGDLRRARPCALPDEYFLSVTELRSLVARVLSGELAFGALVAWGKQAEFLEDLAYDPSNRRLIATVVFEIASPELDDRGEAERLRDWADQLGAR